MTDQNPTEKSATNPKRSDEEVQNLLEQLKKGPPLPRCPRCGEEIPGLYLYVFNMRGPGAQEVLVFQAVCCPFEQCHCVFSVYFVGKQQGAIAHPSGAGWPGIQA
jgi:hypothetical protein